MQQNIEGLAKEIGKMPLDKLVEWYTARAVADGYGDFVTAGACVLCSCLFAVLASRLVRKGLNEHDGDWIAFGLMPAFGSFFALIGAVENISNGLVKVYAPQAAAIDKFIKVVTQ